MPRLPTVDGDLDAWGALLNTWLKFSHDDSGSIVASTARITGASSMEFANVSSTFIAQELRCVQVGSIAGLNVASEAVVGQIVGNNRWTATTTLANGQTTVSVSLADISIQDNSEVHLTIKSPSDTNSVPSQLMINNIVDDTSFDIVANQAATSACPIMYSIFRS